MPWMIIMLDPVYFGDIARARAYWRGRDWAKWRVDVTAGPEKRPTFARTYYAGARDQEGALRAIRANLAGSIPRHARFAIRLAGPRELGCVDTADLEPPKTSDPSSASQDRPHHRSTTR